MLFLGFGFRLVGFRVRVWGLGGSGLRVLGKRV